MKVAAKADVAVQLDQPEVATTLLRAIGERFQVLRSDGRGGFVCAGGADNYDSSERTSASRFEAHTDGYVRPTVGRRHCPQTRCVLLTNDGLNRGAAPADAATSVNEGASLTESRIEAAARIRRGTSIGRYVVVARIGHGAMGDVYSAYDPDLDRKVAIKVLRVRRGSSVGSIDGRTRLLREAQAIAKLSHPNVIVVHDVGTFQDRVFIAMELVEGGTLTYWLHATSRRWREVVKVFISAGRGLQHAHEAHLVHRDFKPDNVMVRTDGEVRVMDFGLVRYADLEEVVTSREGGEQPAPAPSAEPVGQAVPTDLESTINLAQRPSGALSPAAGSAQNTKLTQTGTMLGTPAYMAPEQFVGQTADARTDQFSFCVALYEALFGSRPFDGKTMSELTGKVLAGEVNPPPQRTPVPAGIWRAVKRGLSVSPDERHPSMADLLAELDRHLHPRRKTIIAVAAVALLATLGAGINRLGTSPRTLCAIPTDRFDGVWETSGRTGSRRSAIELAFRSGARADGTAKSTGRSSSWGWPDDRSRKSYHTVASALDRYVADWSATYTDACEATNVRRDQSEQILDRRMSCLNDRFNELRAVSDTLVAPTTELIADPDAALGALGSLDRCSNSRLLRATNEPGPSR